jgi:O-antigen biosynthesis protein
MSDPQNAQDKCIVNFPSDKNGCGYYRTFIPYGYLACKYNYNVTNLMQFVFDLNFIAGSHSIRFQRQVTEAQKKVVFEYKKVIQRVGSKTKLIYEIDDVVHEIMPSNIIAYQFYTETKKNNMIQIMRNVDKVTFSTQFLKDYYKEKFGIENSMVVPNFLPKFLWGDKGKRDKYQKGSKPRILWAGSASHVGKGGDLEFILPLIRKTKNEFEWVFFGVIPPELTGQYEFINWADFYSYPAALDAINADIAIAPIADNSFNYGKSDLKLLEYTALGLPGVYSSIGEGIGPYDLVDNITCVKNNEDDWYQAIKGLITDQSKWNNSLNAAKNELSNRWLEDDKNINVYQNVHS